ncbi:MAG: putative redox protein regulator of disulfide bond formation [Gemmatimonadetes bacterium]|nr:putative redox protein regulator of disulfide bond formation [Gemmatimonadota bacterium]
MGVEMTGTYEGGLKVRLRHGPSGAEISTAAPVDNHGDGSSFSPTDLCAASLGACMVTVMAIVAERDGIPFAGTAFVLEKNMRADPRRIDRIPVTLRMAAGITPEQRRKLEHTALTCPVYRSLLPEIEKDVRFVYPDDAAEQASTAA